MNDRRILTLAQLIRRGPAQNVEFDTLNFAINLMNFCFFLANHIVRLLAFTSAFVNYWLMHLSHSKLAADAFQCH